MLRPPPTSRKGDNQALVDTVGYSIQTAGYFNFIETLYVENGYLTSQKLMITAASSSELDLNPQLLVVHGNK